MKALPVMSQSPLTYPFVAFQYNFDTNEKGKQKSLNQIRQMQTFRTSLIDYRVSFAFSVEQFATKIRFKPSYVPRQTNPQD